MNTKFTEKYTTCLEKEYIFKSIDERLLENNYMLCMFSTNSSEGFLTFNKSKLDKFNIHDNLYCFISHSSWQEKTRITEFFKLKKYLEKKESKYLDFIIESEVTDNDLVLYYGIIEIDKNNLNDVLDVCSLWDTGIIFSWNSLDNRFNELIKKLSLCIGQNSSVSVDKAKMLNIITNYNSNSIIINAYIWQEFNEYCIDVFFKNKRDKKIMKIMGTGTFLNKI